VIYDVAIAGRSYRVALQRNNGGWSCVVDGEPVEVDATAGAPGVLSLLIGGRSYEVKQEKGAAGEFIVLGSERYAAEVRDPRALRSRRAAAGDAAGPVRIVAPMPGKVVRIVAPPGTAVEPGDGVIVIEAMKMQNELKAPKAGKVQQVLAAVGAAVNAGQALAIIE
jgi:biotin carboxyl carrier protein